jgi:Uma2 family endonuclease
MLAGMVQRLPAGYVFDPADPRAPTEAQWAAMTPEERRRVIAMLPAQPDVEFLPPPEGDRHRKAGSGTLSTLDSFFRRDHRRIYISGNLAIYYPNERVFAPDVIAVLDVEPREREHWAVADEGKGIDLAIEILVSGSRAKDLKANVERYARLGIQEYFVFDRGKLSLRGYRLDPARPRVYQPLVPQGGRFPSAVLGLDLTIEGTGLRFYQTTAPLLDAEERIERLAAAFNDAMKRAADAEERVAELERQLEEQGARTADLERQLRELRAELDRRGGGGGAPT